MNRLNGGRRTCVAVLALAVLAGCSGLKTYPNTLEKNLQIQTATKSGSILSKVRARLDIYRVDTPCRLKYVGTVDLDRPVTAIGIPTGRPSYLAFVFASSAFLGGTRSATAQKTLLTPRAGYRYDIDVSYQDDIYNVVLHERAPNRKIGREIALTSLDAINACKAR